MSSLFKCKRKKKAILKYHFGINFNSNNEQSNDK